MSYDLFTDWYASFRDKPEAEWAQKMKAFFAEHGYYRPEDLLRLLGDPNRAVSTGMTLQEYLENR
jgi:hypothetical protein